MDKKKRLWLSLGLAASVATAAGTALAATSYNGAADSSSNSSAAAQMQHESHGKHGGFGLRGLDDNQELLNVLKTDQNTLEQQLKAGKSLADVAAANGVDKQQVIDALTKLRTQQLDQDVKDGKLTQDKADQMKANLSTETARIVDQKGGPRPEGGPGGHGGHKGGHEMENAASVLGISEQDLMTQLQSGKSISDVAKDKGKTEAQVVDELLQKEKDSITQFVQKKDWPADFKHDKQEPAANNAGNVQ